MKEEASRSLGSSHRHRGVPAATGPRKTARTPPSPGSPQVQLQHLSDEELIRASLEQSDPLATACLEVLFRRYYPRVARWCLRFCRNREDAADVAQEVFLRVQSRRQTFRQESRFSTWLYTVMRSVTINHGLAAKHRETEPLDSEQVWQTSDPAPGAEEELERRELIEWLQFLVKHDLEPVEAQVICFHHINGLTLPAITRLLALDNKSGAKAYWTSGMRKLRRRLKDRCYAVGP